MKATLTTRKGKRSVIRSTTKGRKRKKVPPPQPQEVDDNSPISYIACLNNVDDMERFEESEDCFILGFDPSNSNNTAPTPSSMDDDICVLSEKGQVACRDFPHSRHLCVKYPFKTTPHPSYCKMCFCYLCDSPAPCKFWSSQWHCDADNAGIWPLRRKMQKSGRLHS